MERTIHPDRLKNNLANRFLLDVRRTSDLAASDEKLPGSSWGDPEKIEEWIDTLPKDQEIVLYCVRGGSVSSSVVDKLQAKGLKASFIEGGIEGWKSAGGAVDSKP